MVHLPDKGVWGEHLSEVPAFRVSKLPGSIWAPSRPGLWARLSLFLVAAGLGGRREGWEQVASGLVEWSAFSTRRCLPSHQAQDTWYLQGLCPPPRKQRQSRK